MLNNKALDYISNLKYNLRMQKPVLENLQNDIDSLLNYVISVHFSREILQDQIMNVLNDTYIALNKLDECRIENEHLGRFENNIHSVQKYIDYYQDALNKAIENEDKNLEFRHGFIMGVYQNFLNNPDKALLLLRLMIASNILYEFDPDTYLYEEFLSKNDPKMLSTTRRNFDNRDLFLTIYKRLEGYQVTRSKIIKSSGLKIFNFFDVVTKVQKTKLAIHIEFLFATLGEELKIDPKRAGSIRIIGQFDEFTLLDYLGNKKSGLDDFGMEEAFGLVLKNLIMMFKNQGNLAMVRRINNNRKVMEAAFLAKLLT